MAVAVVVAVLLYFVTQAAGGCASMLDGSGESVEREMSQFCHGGGGFYQPCLLTGAETFNRDTSDCLWFFVMVWDPSNRDLRTELQWLFLFAVVLVRAQDADRWNMYTDGA